MIRPFTFIAMLLAALSGAYLFAVKHRAQVLDEQLAALAQSSRLDAQRIRVLQAQWALEIDPTRLNQLAAQFTNLQPMKPAQLVTLAALQDSLPPAGRLAPGANPLAPAPVLPADLPPGSAMMAQTGPALPLPPELPPILPPKLPPVALASNAPVRRAPHVVSRSALHIAATNFAESLPPPQPYPMPAQNSVTAVPVGAQIMSVKAVSASAVNETVTGSALSAAADMAPPQPLSGGSGN